MATRVQIITQAKSCYTQFEDGKGTDSARSGIQAPEWESWFEEWVRDISMFLQYPRKRTSATSTSAQEYALPSDFVTMVKVYFNKNGAGDDVEINFQNYLAIASAYGSAWRSADASVPQVYYFPDEDNYGLMPRPNTTNQGANFITLEYHYFPSVLPAGPAGNGTAPNFPVPYHDSGQYFIAAKAHEHIANPQMHDRLMAIYEVKAGKRKDKEAKKSKGALHWTWVA